MEEVAARPDALQSFRKWVAIAIALSALGFIGYGLYKDLPGTLEQLASFRWSFYLGVLLLTLVNYGLRYGKWHFLLYRLGVRIPNAGGVASWGPGLAPTGGWNAGDVRRLQAWYRDPQGSPCGSFFNLSNGVEVVFVP